MDRGAWRAMVHKIKKSQTPLKQLSTHAQPEHTSQTDCQAPNLMAGFPRNVRLKNWYDWAACCNFPDANKHVPRVEHKFCCNYNHLCQNRPWSSLEDGRGDKVF